jgi:IMP cyclohydrolase
MHLGLQNFPQMEYPGRFIVLGKNKNNLIVVYGVTARNPSSRSKRYVYDKINNIVVVEPIDKEIMSQGNLDLLQYTAIRFFSNGIIVGNGQQTNLFSALTHNFAFDELKNNLSDVSFEPDKYNTPRITGCFLYSTNTFSAALSSIRADFEGKVLRKTWNINLGDGCGKFLSTYAGPNIRPTPSFAEDPIDILLNYDKASDLTRDIFDLIKPSEGRDDLRVSVVSIFLDLKNFNKEVSIHNLA